jgi:hypothetical protein
MLRVELRGKHHGHTTVCEDIVVGKPYPPH